MNTPMVKRFLRGVSPAFPQFLPLFRPANLLLNCHQIIGHSGESAVNIPSTPTDRLLRDAELLCELGKVRAGVAPKNGADEYHIERGESIGVPLKNYKQFVKSDFQIFFADEAGGLNASVIDSTTRPHLMVFDY